MATKTPVEMDEAVFTDAARRNRRPQWKILCITLLALGIVYGAGRSVVHEFLVTSYIQKVLHTLVGAEVEDYDSVTVTHTGDVIITNAEVYAYHRDTRRLLYRAAAVRVALNGIPLRDPDLKVMRVDLEKPEIFLRREHGGDWNLAWVIGNRTKDPRPWDPTRKDPSHFPPNGVHVHDGVIHATVVSSTGSEVTYTVTEVNGSVREPDGILTVDPVRGDFYGGRLTAYAEISQGSPLTIDQLTVRIRDADVAKIARETSVIERRVSGRLNAVFAGKMDPVRTRQRPIVSGRAEITKGNLWEFPALAGVLSVLSLGDVSDRKIDSALLEFTFEEESVRIDKMYFLGYPVSLFGDGRCGLGGEWIKVVFVPRLGKKDWESILPIVGAPLQWISDFFKGTLTPVVLTGSFEKPVFAIDPLHFLKPAVREMIKEKTPQ